MVQYKHAWYTIHPLVVIYVHNGAIQARMIPYKHAWLGWGGGGGGGRTTGRGTRPKQLQEPHVYQTHEEDAVSSLLFFTKLFDIPTASHSFRFRVHVPPTHSPPSDIITTAAAHVSTETTLVAEVTTSVAVPTERIQGRPQGYSSC